MGLYTGSPTVAKNTTLLTHTAEDYMSTFREVIFYSTNLLKALTLSAFGKAAAIGNETFGDVTKTSGKGVIFNKGGYQFSGPLMTEAPSATYVDQMGNINPQHNDPATGWAYSWCRGVVPVYIPEEFVKDNIGNRRLLDRMKTELKLAQLAAIREVTYGLTGHSSAATGSPGDSTRKLSINYLASVTQTTAGVGSPGGISPVNSYWQNVYVQNTSVGGGGLLDRPLQLLRDMEKTKIKVRARSGSSNEQLLLGTTGAWQYYGRAAYADTVAQGVAGHRLADYYDANIDHRVYDGRPFIYDGYLQGPIGQAASTREAIYYLDLNSFGICFKQNEYFEVEGWEAPRAHDKQRYYQMNIWFRWIPYTMDRRVQGVLYDIAANPDVPSSLVA